MRLARVAFSILVPLSVLPSFRRLSAQDTSRVLAPGAQVVPTDTTHRIGPGGAFWRSLLLPGWGQAATGRQVSGALFTTWEGITAMMTLKARREANYLSRIGASGRRSSTSGAGSLMCFIATATKFSPGNGTSPVSSS